MKAKLYVFYCLGFFTILLFEHLDKAMLMKWFPEILELLGIVQKTTKLVKKTLWNLEFKNLKI